MIENFSITILEQLFGYMALASGMMSYVFKKQKSIKFTLGTSSIFWSVHYFLLGSLTTCVIQLVSTLRSWTSIFVKTKSQKNILFWSITLVMLFFTFYTWHGYSSLLPLAVGINSSVALCYMSNKNMRKLLFLSSILWFLNGFIWGSVPQMITEVIKILVNLYTFQVMDKNGEFTRFSRLTFGSAKPLKMNKEEYDFEKEIKK